MTKSWKVGVLWLAAAACGDDTDAAVEDSDAGACAAVTYESFGKPFLDTYCASCHAASKTGAARMAAPPDAVFDTVAQVRAERAALEAQVVDTKLMPFGNASPKPSDADRAKFGQWLACGAP